MISKWPMLTYEKSCTLGHWMDLCLLLIYISYSFWLSLKASDKFCNFPKLTIRHWCPLQTAFGQVCRGEKLCRCRTSLSRSLVSLFTQVCMPLFMPTSECNSMMDCDEGPSKNVCCYPHRISNLPWTVAVQNSNKHWLPNMVEQHVVQTSLFWAIIMFLPISVS